MKKKYIKPKIKIKKIRLNYFFENFNAWSLFEMPVVVAYGSYSDVRLKKNINRYDDTDILEKLGKLQIISYNWNNKIKHSQTESEVQIGLSAQEVEKLFPQVVIGNPRDYKKIDYSKIIALLILAVQKLNRQNKALKSLLAKAVSAR